MSKIYNVNGDILSVYDEVSLKVPWKTEMHRGYSSTTVPENTLPAFYRAYLNKADGIECDARIASDGVYICYHDATVTVGGTTYTIASETSETLTSLVLSTDDTYGEITIPTLEDVLKLALFTGLYINLDCKSINASTLAKLVVDSGMSGRVFYANTSSANVPTILSVDPNAGFSFGYSADNLSAWATAITDYRVRERSYVWKSVGSATIEEIEATRAYGFKYLMSEENSTRKMALAPDIIEFQTTVDSNAVNKSYLASLELF